MKFNPVTIDFYENTSNDWAIIHDVVKVGRGSRIIRAQIEGPFYVNRNTQIGPEVSIGKYSGFNENCFLAHAEMGAFCAIGARTAINAFNHPLDWLSTHEFQYHAKAYDWVPEWNTFKRLDRGPEMIKRTVIGNDVWMGHNVNVIAGADIGDGAVIAAGSVVTKPVPPYAVVAGVPATVRKMRFDDRTIERLRAVRWWEFELLELSGLNFRNVQECLSRLESMRTAKAG